MKEKKPLTEQREKSFVLSKNHDPAGSKKMWAMRRGEGR
jgi:hypothetical protein